MRGAVVCIIIRHFIDTEIESKGKNNFWKMLKIGVVFWILYTKQLDNLKTSC